jgi:hypothetical protein
MNTNFDYQKLFNDALVSCGGCPVLAAAKVSRENPNLEQRLRGESESRRMAVANSVAAEEAPDRALEPVRARYREEFAKAMELHGNDPVRAHQVVMAAHPDFTALFAARDSAALANSGVPYVSTPYTQMRLSDSAPLGPENAALMGLSAGATRDEVEAVWKANGNKHVPTNVDAVLEALVSLYLRTQSNWTRGYAIGHIKDKHPNLARTLGLLPAGQPKIV